MIRYGGPVKTRVTSRGSPISYPSSVNRTLDGQRYYFNGVDMFVTIPPWTPTTSGYQIKVSTVLSRLTNSTGQYAVSSSAFGTFVGTNASGAIATRLLPSGTVRLAGGPINVDDVDTVTLDVRLTDLDIASLNFSNNFIDSTDPTAWARIAGYNAATACQGLVGEVRLTDNADPNNSRYYPINEGTGATVICYEEDGSPKPDNTLDGTINGFNPLNWVTYSSGQKQ